MTVQQIAELLARHDPEELISLGAPPDEYEAEAAEIARRLVMISDEAECLRLLEHTWQRYFSGVTPGCRERLRQVALDLWRQRALLLPNEQ